MDRYHVVMTSMMFRADKFFLAYDRALKTGLLKLPMTEGAAMLVVFPDADVDVTVVEEQVTSEKIQTWIQQLKKTYASPHCPTPWSQTLIPNPSLVLDPGPRL